jgi:DNA-binding transcriptional MerR regulator
MQGKTRQDEWDKQQKTQQEDSGETQVSRKSRRGKKASGAFRTISEVASMLGVQQHVLRFWESKFTQVKPLKRGGGRRYYRPEDVELLQRIHHLLYEKGYTIRGVQKLLKSTRGSVAVLDKKVEEVLTSEVEELKETVAAVAEADDAPVDVETQTAAPAIAKLKTQRREILRAMLDDLKAMRQLIEA